MRHRTRDREYSRRVFVSFEGPEGAGKSTLISTIGDRLLAAGLDVVVTREPGAGKFGASVRRLLLEDDDMNARAELFLFLADRAQHVATLIRPAIEAGKWVLCDRYVDSTLVYQAIARGLDRDFVEDANKFATGGLIPDRTLLLDLDPKIGLSRLKSKDRMDAQPIEFHIRVRDGFLSLAAEDPARWRVLDATQSVDKVAEAAWSALKAPSNHPLR